MPAVERRFRAEVVNGECCGLFGDCDATVADFANTLRAEPISDDRSRWGSTDSHPFGSQSGCTFAAGTSPDFLIPPLSVDRLPKHRGGEP
jgi:hypothetical protein